MFAMLHRFRNIKEPYRMILIGALTVIVLVAGKTWPGAEPLLWIVFLGAMGMCLVRDLRDPVNYISLEFDSDGFRHEGTGDISSARWEDVKDVFYMRSFDSFSNQIETEWRFQLRSEEFVCVLVEWPHRKPFARAIAANLSIVSKDFVLRTPCLRGEGSWRCVSV